MNRRGRQRARLGRVGDVRPPQAAAEPVAEVDVCDESVRAALEERSALEEPLGAERLFDVRKRPELDHGPNASVNRRHPA